MLESGLKLANNLEILIEDQSRNYFGDYHYVKLVVSASIPVHAVRGLHHEEVEEFLKLPKPMVSYTKILDKMGVWAADVNQVKEQLIADFEQHALNYLESPEFPSQLVRSSLARMKRRKA